jgi:hypothetical protein
VRLPLVAGRRDGRVTEIWIPKVLSTREPSIGRTCRVVSYEPPADARGPWQDFSITPRGPGQVVLLSACAIDREAEDRRAEDQDARDDLRDAVDEAGSIDPTLRREIVLEPGETYEIAVTWSWTFWRSQDEGRDTPPAPADWQPADEVQRFHFRVAHEDAATGETQDGLNEHVFDARDIARYLNLVEPADGREVHFTGDPVWAHFDAGHVGQLVETYGRRLEIEVRRTDPPPQPDAPALADALAPRPGLTTWMAGPPSLDAPSQQRINAAALLAPCLPEAPVAGGASLAGQFELEPLAMYDFNLVAPRLDGSDPVLVSGTRFLTSRFDGPPALVRSLGFATDGTGPFPPDEIVLDAPAALPAGPLEVSDALMADLLRALDAETLPLPQHRGRSYLIWSLDGAGWQVQGLLLDSLETLDRTAAVDTGSGAEIVTRCRIAAGRLGAAALTPLRATRNWTRVFLAPSAPVRLAPGQHELSVSFETSGGPLTGRRTLSHQPKLLEQEGLS